MSLGKQIAEYRKKAGLTQSELAEMLEISFQAVSGWERDEYAPDVNKLVPIAKALNTSVGRLLEECPLPTWDKRKRLFNEEHMYTYAKALAIEAGLFNTARALPYIREKHNGQTRKGEQADVPYINHPLTMACEAFSIGIRDDDVLSAILLHDIVEDCHTTVEELPFNESVREIVRLVTFDAHGLDRETAKKRYYEEIAANPKASLVKCIDRVNNLSNMALGFTKERMAGYVLETEKYVVPLLRVVRDAEPAYANVVWILAYHMYSLLETYKRLL